MLAIPTSSVAYEFTRKVYDFLGLNINAIAAEFNSYDLLDVKMLDRRGRPTKNVDYARVATILKQTKPLDKIKLNDNIEEAGESKMQFQAVVGNPPYQVSDGGGTGSSALPIYNNFVDISKSLIPSYISMIIPSRWMLGGKGLDDFRADMINDTHIRVMHDYLDSKFCFSQVSVEGGVCYFLMDCDNTGKCMFVSHSEKGLNKKERLLTDGDSEVIVRSIDAVPIVKKTKDKRGVFSSIVSTRNLFKVNESKLIKTKKPVEVFGRFNNRRDIRYLANYDTKDCRARSFLGKYKVFVSKADGAAGFLGNPVPARVIGLPELGGKNTICTETFLAVGPFDTEYEAKAVMKYMSTRFFRFLVGARKLKNMTQETYSFVPMQDFSKRSDIDWSKSVAEIDQQLYKKYGLDKKEIDFIESMIKPME